MKMNFREKSENVMFLHSLRLSYMQKIRKFYRAVFRKSRGETDRKTETDPNSRVLRTLSLSRRTKKSEKSIARFSGKGGGRQREREKERDGPEFKGPPDAIAKLSDQKASFSILGV